MKRITIAILVGVAAMGIACANPTPSQPVSKTTPKPVPSSPTVTPTMTVKKTPKPAPRLLRPSVQEAEAVVDKTKTITSLNLGPCLLKAGYTLWIDYVGVENSRQLEYSNGDDTTIIINVSTNRKALPWKQKDLELVRLIGCTIPKE